MISPQIYVLREILHDWSDADSLRILREVGPGRGRACWRHIPRSCRRHSNARAPAPPRRPAPRRRAPTPRPPPQVRTAIGARAGCRLVIVEAVLASAMLSTASARVIGDVHMLSQYGDAKERTEAQLRDLLGAAGFKMTRVVPTKGLFFVVEAVCA